MKERKKNKNREEKIRRATAKPRPTISRVRNQVPTVPIIELKKRSVSKIKTKEKKSRKEKRSLIDSIRLPPNIQLPPPSPPSPPRKLFFEQTLENAAPSERKPKGVWNADQMAARRALRRPFYAFPEGQQNFNIPPVDQTDLYLDPTDWDSESSLDDDHEPPPDSVFIKDPRLGPGRSGWVPCLEKVAAFIPKHKKPGEDPLLLIEFRIQHGLFDRNLETARNPEKECARRWRVLEALKTEGLLDNLWIFDVLPPSNQADHQ